MSSPIRVFLMLRVLLASMSLFLTACEAPNPPASIVAEGSTERNVVQPFVPGEVLIKFKPSISSERIDAILKESGTELIHEIKGVGIHHVRIVGKESVESVVKKLSTFQEIEYAEPNFRFGNQ